MIFHLLCCIVGLIPVTRVSNGKGGWADLINQGLDSLPPPTASALLQPPLVKTIPAVTAMVAGAVEDGLMLGAVFDEASVMKISGLLKG